MATAQSKGPETKVGGKNAPPTSLTFSSASTGGSRNNFGIASRGGISLREEGRASVGESGGRDGLDGLAENGVDVTTGERRRGFLFKWVRTLSVSVFISRKVPKYKRMETVAHAIANIE